MMKPEELKPALVRWSENGWDVGGIQDLADIPLTAIIPDLLSEAHQAKLADLDERFDAIRNQDGSIDRQEWYDAYCIGRDASFDKAKVLADMLDSLTLDLPMKRYAIIPWFQIGVIDGIRTNLVRQKAQDIIKELELEPPARRP